MDVGQAIGIIHFDTLMFGGTPLPTLKDLHCRPYKNSAGYQPKRLPSWQT